MTSSGAKGEKLTSLLRLIKRDRGELHLKEGMRLADAKEWSAAVEELQLALYEFEEIEDGARMSAVLAALALCRFGQGDLEGAEVDSRRSIEAMRQGGDREGEATAILGLGYVLLARGEYSKAQEVFHEALSLFRAESLWEGVTRSYLGLERALRANGQEEEADEARAKAEDARRRLAHGI
ncbi:MAG: tetratricopeptide repeat protein [Methanomassiliicoccales archaeon]